MKFNNATRINVHDRLDTACISPLLFESVLLGFPDHGFPGPGDQPMTSQDILISPIPSRPGNPSAVSRLLHQIAVMIASFFSVPNNSAE